MSLDGIHKNLWRAGLFLHHLHDEQRYPHLRFEEFAAYLSAFLACARYVTDSFERAKDKGDPERTKWQKDYKARLSQDERAFLNFMIRQRDLEQHEGGAETEARVKYVSHWEPESHAPRHYFDGYETFAGPPGVAAPKKGRMAHTWQVAGNSRDVLDDCRRYLALLERVVRDFSIAHLPMMSD